MSDPLSYLAGETSSSSDSEAENGSENPSNDVIDKKSSKDKLPPPDSLFESVGTPSFLYNPNSGRVDWDKLVKNDTAETDLNVHASDGRYAAIAPPSGNDLEEDSKHNKKVHSSLTAAIVNTYSTTSGEISAPPVRYTTKDVDPKFRTVSDGPEIEEGRSSTKKRDNPSSDSGVEEASKKQKVQNFRQKEKRKRDEGQSSRGKSYVEEEKRILRQNFSTDEVMS